MTTNQTDGKQSIDRADSVRSPALRVSDFKKRKSDFQHTKIVIDNYISAGILSHNYSTSSSDTARNPRLFYEAYNNNLPDEYFTYVVNPLNSSKKEYTNWPARLRPYTIIRPNIDLIAGEYERRPLVWTVKVHNQDAPNIMLEQQYEQIVQTLQQQFINALNKKGMDTGVETAEPEPPASIKAKFTSNYKDERAVVGEAALNILIDQLHIIELWKRLFMDWLIAGEIYTYKNIYGDRMCYERVSPLDIDYDKAPDTRYIEDGQWVVRRMYMVPSDITDKFHKELTEKEIDIIEDENGLITTRAMHLYSQYDSREDVDLKRSKVPVYHVAWKYLTKIGILSYTNELGEPLEMEVPETYKAEEGESIEWFWVNEVWEGYRVGADIYLGIGPVSSQRNTVYNMSECKLPYNGRRYSDTHSQAISIVEMGLPYETMHRILHFHLEKTIAKSKGKILLMDQNAIPKTAGWDEEKFFYWAEANGWALVNRNQPGADKSFNQYAAIDMGLYEHIANLISLMEFVKAEWDQVLGITNPRKGEMKSTDTVRGTQSSIAQSAVISERTFSGFEEFIESELRGLLDVSKLAWADGFSAMYQGEDMRNAILQIDPSQYIESDYGVYISRSARDIQNLEMVRQQVQSFAQNGVSPSTIIDVVQAQSLSKLRTVLKEAEVKSMEAQQKSVQSEQEAEQRLEMIKQSFMELQGTIDERLLNLKYDREEDLALLEMSGIDQNPLPTTDPNAAQQMMLQDGNDKAELALKARTEAVKARQKDRELDLKDKDINTKKKIADKQATVALKNKVVGEGKSKK